MPIEIGWAATVQWRAGDFSCRILAFFRTFGLFLSSFVLVCISIDRYASMDCIIDTGWHMLLYSIAFHTRFGAILQPMKLDYWKRRGRFMLAIAWACSVICSLPQVGNMVYLFILFLALRCWYKKNWLSVAASLLLKKLWKWRLIKAHWCSSQILPFEIIKSRCHPATFVFHNIRKEDRFIFTLQRFLEIFGSFFPTFPLKLCLLEWKSKT